MRKYETLKKVRVRVRASFGFMARVRVRASTETPHSGKGTALINQLENSAQSSRVGVRIRIQDHLGSSIDSLSATRMAVEFNGLGLGLGELS